MVNIHRQAQHNSYFTLELLTLWLSFVVSCHASKNLNTKRKEIPDENVKVDSKACILS
jgi:hypothetical protein